MIPIKHSLSSRPIRVLHVAASLTGGGLERGLVRLVSEPNDGGIAHGVCILRFGDDHLISGCRAHAPTWVLGAESARQQKPIYSLWPKLRRVVSEFGADIVHARGTATWFDTILATIGKRSTRSLLAFHGLTNLAPVPLRRRLLNRFSAACADTVLSISRPAADMMHREWGVHTGKLQVIPDGVDTRLFRPVADTNEKTAIRATLDIPVDVPLAVCVANLLPIKGLDNLLASWREVVVSCRHARLLIVGEGPLRDELEIRKQHLRLDGSVDFLGRREDVPALLRAADLFALCSHYEGTSNAVQEAMATGLPVVATDVGGMRDLIRPGENGWLVPDNALGEMSAAIRNVLNDRSLQDRMGSAARSVAEQQFSFERWVARYEALYRTLRVRNVSPVSNAVAMEEVACVG